MMGLYKGFDQKYFNKFDGPAKIKFAEWVYSYENGLYVRENNIIYNIDMQLFESDTADASIWCSVELGVKECWEPEPWPIAWDTFDIEWRKYARYALGLDQNNNPIPGFKYSDRVIFMYFRSDYKRAIITNIDMLVTHASTPQKKWDKYTKKEENYSRVPIYFTTIINLEN